MTVSCGTAPPSSNQRRSSCVSGTILHVPTQEVDQAPGQRRLPVLLSQRGDVHQQQDPGLITRRTEDPEGFTEVWPRLVRLAQPKPNGRSRGSKTPARSW